MSPWFITQLTLPSRPGAHPPGPAKRIRLFATPYAGRGASLFFPWRAALPDWIELVAVQLPGREGRIAEPAWTRMDAIVAAPAREILSHLDGPYVLFGHSMGALVSFELARALRRGHAPAPLALALSGRRAPSSPNPDPPLHVLSDAEFIDAICERYDGIPPAVLAEPELMNLFLPTLRRDIEAIETYAYAPEPPLDLPFLLYGGEADWQTPTDSLAAWRGLTTGPTPLRLFPGGHFYLQTGQAALLQAILQDLMRLSCAYSGLDFQLLGRRRRGGLQPVAERSTSWRSNSVGRAGDWAARAGSAGNWPA